MTQRTLAAEQQRPEASPTSPGTAAIEESEAASPGNSYEIVTAQRSTRTNTFGKAPRLDVKPLNQTLFAMHFDRKSKSNARVLFRAPKKDEIQEFLNIRSKRKLVKFKGGKYQFQAIRHT